MKKIIRTSTIGLSLDTFCRDMLSDLRKQGYEMVALSSPDDELRALGEREGVRTIGVNMERHISLKNDLKSLYHLVKVFRREKPDMVHSMTPKAGLLCMIAAWMARVPIRMHTFTGLVWPTATGLSRKILMTTDRITCACATHVVPEGQGVLSDLRDFGITRKPMKVLGYGNVRGVDMIKYSRRAEVMEEAQKHVKENTFSFVFVGRIVGDKGINELVSAFAELVEEKRKDSSALTPRLLLVGMFEEKLDPVTAETRNLIESIPEIETPGPQFGDALLTWYAASDCFVFPSYREGFPNTVLEAGAMGLPSIVTDINGSREIITNAKSELSDTHMKVCENGVIIPSKDRDALLDAMRWIMDHDSERQQMAGAARRMVEERFEQGFVRQQLYKYYREVLGE